MNKNSSVLKKQQISETKADFNRNSSSEYIIFKELHFNFYKDSIIKIKVEKIRNRFINILFFIGSFFFLIIYIQSYLMANRYALVICVSFLVAFKYLKFYNWFLWVVYEDKSQSKYKMLTSEKGDAQKFMINFNKSFQK